MADAHSPEEWPKHGGGSACRDLDGAVRCPICGDPFETPLSLRCGHAFCSGCVRSSIEYQERSGPASCPQCRDRCDAADLRPAPQLRAVAAAFLAARPLLLVSVRASLGVKDAGAVVPGTQPQARGRARHQRQQHTQQDQRPGRLRAHQQPSLPPNGAIISVELSSGSEPDTPTAKPQAAERRQQPKRGRSASAVPGEEADASHSTGSGKRRQRSSPSDGRQQTPSPGEAQPGPRLLRSAGRAAASAPVPSSGDLASVAAEGASKAGGRAMAEFSAADGVEDAASDSDPEYLGEQHPDAGSSDDEAAAQAAAKPAPKQPPAREKLPSGHVRCPNCAKMLPQAFINSHLDSCLTGKSSGGGIWGGSRSSKAAAAVQQNGVRPSTGGSGNTFSSANGSGSGPLPHGNGRATGGSGGQLKVPPKLCVALLSDKAMRDTCKSFGLPATGRKEVLAERYSRLRLEVQTANDAGEAASYADCVRRVRQRESRTAKAAFGAPLSRTAAASSPAGMGESSFEELIRATRQRHAAQRAAGAPAAAAAPPDAAAAAPPTLPPEPAGTAEVAVLGPPPPDAASPAQPAGAIPDDGVAHPAAGGQDDLLPPGQQPEAALGTRGSQSADAAAPAVDAAGLTHTAAQPLLDEQSRSASRSMEAAAARPLDLHVGSLNESPAAYRKAQSGDATQPLHEAPHGTALRREHGQGSQEQPASQHGAAGQRPMPDRAQHSDAAAGRASLDAALPGGMMCTQPPPQLGPALSCGQQLQMQLQQPFTFEGAFSDDSRSCPLSPSV